MHGILRSDDVWHMINGLKKILNNVEFYWEKDVLIVSKTSPSCSNVQGSTPCEVYVGNSGTAARFLTSLAAICTSQDAIITGNDRMQSRPIGDLVDALTKYGASITYLNISGSLPIRIHPPGFGVHSKFGAISIDIVASESSQFVSALLMCAPYAGTDLEINIVSTKITSQPYIDMTLAMMEKFGIEVDTKDKPIIYRTRMGSYKNPSSYHIEGDATSAAYPLCIAAAGGFSVTVANVGSSSIQGDASFAPKILSRMSAIVLQTETSTTVWGPAGGKLLPLGRVDMGKWTDSFPVTAAIAALAPPTDSIKSTRIVGIENQRVKECNRIEAMVNELRKFGVSCVEHEDGIEIFGTNRYALHPPALPGCLPRDDHRIAMGISVLASSLEKYKCTIISQRRCVEKTWPSWWRMLSSSFCVTIESKDACKLQNCYPKFSTLDWHLKYAYSFPPVRDFAAIKSVVLIGFRGVGKSYLGKAIKRITNMFFIDMDAYFSEKTGLSIQEYVENNGWMKFRELEVLYLEEVLAANPEGSVVACGGGIVTTEIGRTILKNWMGRNEAVVIHVWRDIERDVIPLLTSDDSLRPDYPCEHLKEWQKRKAYYEDCSNYEFFNTDDRLSVLPNGARFLKTSAMRLAMLIHHASTEVCYNNGSCDEVLLSARMPPSRYRSHFICLKVKKVEDVLVNLDKILSGASAMEFRADGLESYDTVFVSTQLALLRSCTFLPVIFTLRSAGHSGVFPADLEY